MFLKSRINTIIILAISFIIINTAIIHAAWWEEKRFPVPQNTEQVKQQTKKIAGFDFKFTYYVSTQDTQSIKEFYRRELGNLGWSERQLQQDLAKIKNDAEAASKLKALPGNMFSDSKDDTAGNIFFENNLVFEKDEVMLTITFLPEAAVRDGKTKFSLSEGKLELQKKQAISESQYVPELLAKPKKNVTPLYPGAILINLSEKEDYLKATYFTKDYIEDVADFYKQNMSGFGWSLINETPVTKVDFTNLAKYNQASACPDCERNLALASAMTEMWFMELGFSNSRQDSCKIGLFNNIIKGEQIKPMLNFTNIRIEYEKKK